MPFFHVALSHKGLLLRAKREGFNDPSLCCPILRATLSILTIAEERFLWHLRT
jgi:hypothetical protein